MNDRFTPKFNSSINDVCFVSFDLETTGLDSNKDNILELGAVKFTTLEIIDTYQSFVNYEGEIPEAASRVNNIYSEMLVNAPAISDVLSNFLNLIKGSVLVAHNIFFDFRFINAELLHNNFEALSNMFMIDTVQVAKKAVPGLQSYALGELAKHFTIDLAQAHRALDDALTCRAVLMRCLDKMSILGELPLSEVLV